MMGFFKTIPRDIEEAAMIDGLSRFGAFVKVIVPISSAGLLTVVIFTLTLVMPEFVYGLTFITSSSHYTVSVGVPTFLVRGDVYFWGSLMGACLIVSVPIAVLYNFFVDRFVAGFFRSHQITVKIRLAHGAGEIHRRSPNDYGKPRMIQA